MVDEILRSPGLVGDRGGAHVDAKLTVERGEDLLIVDGAILRDFTQAIGRTDHLSHPHPAAGEQAT